MLQIIKYEVNKPLDEDTYTFIKKIEDNIGMFVHDLSNDVSITVTYDSVLEKASVKTLRMYEHAN